MQLQCAILLSTLAGANHIAAASSATLLDAFLF